MFRPLSTRGGEDGGPPVIAAGQARRQALDVEVKHDVVFSLSCSAPGGVIAFGGEGMFEASEVARPGSVEYVTVLVGVESDQVQSAGGQDVLESGLVNAAVA